MGKKKKIAISGEAILQRYKDPEAAGSLGGVVRFARAQGIPVSRARRVLQKNLSYTLHKPRRVRFPTEKVMAQRMDHQWVADLVEVQRIPRYNKGYKYLLAVVDVLSKHGWVQPVKAKTGVELVKAFEKILKSQRGKEFYNQTFQSFLKKNNIHHFSTYGDAKASVVERFNRTLKLRMYRYFTAANTLCYEDVLQSLVRGYNATRHRSIGMAPKDVNWKNERAVWKRLYGSRKKKDIP